MDIQSFLRTVDQDDVAHATGASPHTVAKWRTGDRFPKRSHVLALVKFSKGNLTLESVYSQRGQRRAA